MIHATDHHGHTHEFRQLRVLVVDDEPMLRSVIQEFLEMMGFEDFHLASDGIEALEIVRREHIDCMLSDIRMPRMELDELLQIVRIEFPQLMIIATSGFNDMDSAYHIFSRGAHDFLGKPLNLESLEIALAWIVERRAALDEARRLFAAAAAAPAGVKEPNLPIEAFDRYLDRNIWQFRALIGHARRLGKLASLLDPAIDAASRRDLTVAAYLHEFGASFQMYLLCQQPRRLDPRELRLVQAHSAIAARLAARALAESQMETIIGMHGTWEDLSPAIWNQSDRNQRLACWMGMLNSVDGWLHTRPDREGISIGELREMLQRRLKNNTVEPLRRLLDQWPVVEEFYARQA